MSGYETNRDGVGLLNTEINHLCERLSELPREGVEIENAISRQQHERQELLREEAVTSRGRAAMV
ncbi:MAG: hypothetical protein WCJ56_01965 [bacterium]